VFSPTFHIVQVKLFVGVYHGSESLGKESTDELPLHKGFGRINKTLTFKLAVKDIQTSNKLCFAVHGRMSGSKVRLIDLLVFIVFQSPGVFF